jgi:hypothetical protein
MDLIFGRWRSQTLYAGVELGVFEAVGSDPTPASEITDHLAVDAELGYRLLRALGAIGLLAEASDRRFALTPAGELLRENHPESLRGVTLLEEGPAHYALWKHLPDMVREGQQNAFVREFGHMAFDHAEDDSAYGAVFNDAMTSYSQMQTAWVLDALADYDLSSFSTLCDVGGGFGHLLCSLLAEHDPLEGTVLDRPTVVESTDRLWAPKLGVDDRCTYVAGDMFEAVPSADAYLMKMILHDWNDEECRQILSNIREASSDGARLFVVEHLVTDPSTPHFSKLFDIHMMCWGTGRERTTDEYAALLEESGWEYETTWHPENGLMGAVEAAPA